MITLIRHATPNVDYSKCDYKIARQRMALYNQTKDINLSELDDFIKSSLLNEIKQSQPLVYSSPIGRAERTCQVLFQTCYLIDNELREVDLEILKLPFIKLKLQHWFFISRLIWMFSLGEKTEKIKHAKMRAELIFSKLNLKENAVVVSHGFILHYVKKQLKKNKYQNIALYKKGCFTVLVYDK